MCEILCLTVHDPAERDAIIQRVWNEMKRSQHDGYGAAWFSPDGQIGWYKTRWPVIPTKAKPNFVKPDFLDFNDVESDGGYLIIHGRGASANTPITLANTHPMLAVDGNMVMVHNGFVWSNTIKYKNIAPCTCDSELLMMAYQDGGIEAVSKHIGGSFAFMALEFKDDKKLLHVAKDDKKTLYAGQIEDGYVLATTRDLIDTVGANLMGEPKDHHLMIFGRADDGFEMIKFEPYKIQTYVAEEFDELDWRGQRPYIPALPDTVNAEVVDDDEEIRRQELEPIPL